jgi:hypothetical protein
VQVHSNFKACYGVDDTGDIYNSANIRDFRSIVMAKTGGTRGTQTQRTRGTQTQRTRGTQTQRTRGTQTQRTRGAQVPRARGNTSKRSFGAPPTFVERDCTAAIPIRNRLGLTRRDFMDFAAVNVGSARVLRGSSADARTVAACASGRAAGGTCGTLAGVGLDLVTADGGASSDDDKNFQAPIALQRCNVQHDVQHATRRLQDATHSMQRR